MMDVKIEFDSSNLTRINDRSSEIPQLKERQLSYLDSNPQMEYFSTRRFLLPDPIQYSTMRMQPKESEPYRELRKQLFSPESRYASNSPEYKIGDN